MGERKKAIDIKYDSLYQSLYDKELFTVADAFKVWNCKLSTAYWYLAKLADAGKIKRIQKGTYSFFSEKPGHMPMPSEASERIQNILLESGYPYYISGIDVLLRFMQHIPDQYPIIVYVDHSATNDVAELLLMSGMTVIAGKEYLVSQSFIERNLITNLVLLYPSRNFSYAIDGFATNEKAFVDLYFEVTRRAYPLPLQELARIFQNMMDQGAIQRGKLLRAAHERSIRSEMVLIFDVNQMNPSAIKLVELIKGESR
ncbi:MAG: DUF6577 family protein [Bacillota bacterium]|nr:DUF6577 family protein [Bacillota bacterium]